MIDNLIEHACYGSINYEFENQIAYHYIKAEKKKEYFPNKR